MPGVEGLGVLGFWGLRFLRFEGFRSCTSLGIGVLQHCPVQKA